MLPLTYRTSTTNKIKKLKILLPTMFPIATLKFFILNKDTEELSSGREVAIPRNRAPARPAPRFNYIAILSVTFVIMTLDTIRQILAKTNLNAICFAVRLLSIATSLSFSAELSSEDIYLMLRI